MKLVWLIPCPPAGRRGRRPASSASGWASGRRLAGRRRDRRGRSPLAVGVVRDLHGAARRARVYVRHFFDWIHGRDTSTWASDLRLDTLSATMILVVTGIGTLIHIYAIGYMHGDPRYGRFFAYLNLFVFFMLMLVLADNFLLLYLGLGGRGALLVPADRVLVRADRERERGEEGVHHHAIGDTAMLIGLALICRRSSGRSTSPSSSAARAPCCTKDRPPPSRCCCSPAPSASPRRCRCTSGCPTPWRARRPSRP